MQSYNLPYCISIYSVPQDRAERAVRYAKTQEEEEKAARQLLLHSIQAEQEGRKEALIREKR